MTNWFRIAMWCWLYGTTLALLVSTIMVWRRKPRAWGRSFLVPYSYKLWLTAAGCSFASLMLWCWTVLVTRLAGATY